MARRLGDRVALGYALNAAHARALGHRRRARAVGDGTELGEIADDLGDELLALHGHMWRIRELLARGDVDAVNEEIARFRSRDTGPVHPVEASYAFNVTAMMALLAGDFETAEELGQRALHVAEGQNELALSLYGALMMWTWWQRGDFGAPDSVFGEVLAQAPATYPTVSAALALMHAEAGDREAALRKLAALAAHGWENVAADQAEGVSLALAAAACNVVGAPAQDFAAHLYDVMRPYAGTAVVVRAPAAACVGPADHYLGLLAETLGDLALAEVHHDAALRLARRMGSPPFVAASQMELARTVRRRRPTAEKERVAELLRERVGGGTRHGPAPAGGAGHRARLIRSAGGLVPLRDGRSRAGLFFVGGQPVVRLADAPAHAAEQSVAEARDLHHRLEFPRADDQDLEVGGGRHGGAAGHGFDGGQLAEVVAGPEDVDHVAFAGDRRRALQNDEELAAESAFAEDHLAGLNAEALGDPGHFGELLLGTRGEPRHTVQAVRCGLPVPLAVGAHRCLPKGRSAECRPRVVRVRAGGGQRGSFRHPVRRATRPGGPPESAAGRPCCGTAPRGNRGCRTSPRAHGAR